MSRIVIILLSPRGVGGELDLYNLDSGLEPGFIRLDYKPQGIYKHLGQFLQQHLY
jgi:hypothetical protein